MILTRLMKAVREQNWFAVAIEFVIVILGVAIGFQVTGWHQARTDRADETASLHSLHDELVSELAVAERIRAYRLLTEEHLQTATDIIFGRAEHRPLTAAECDALASSNVLYIGRSNLPTLARLQATGRLDIISNMQIREALTRLIQTRESLEQTMMIEGYLYDVAHLYPEAFSAHLSYSAAENGVPSQREVSFECDLELILENERLIFNIARNADGYDAYLRDGLLPWLTQFEQTHLALDDHLGIQHDNGEAP